MKGISVISNIALIVIAVMTVVLLMTANPKLDVAHSNPQIVDYYLKSGTAQKINAEGRVEYTLKGESFNHIPFRSTTKMTHPEFINNPQQGSPWDIKAEKGIALEGDKTIKVWDHVILHRKASASNQETTLLTESAVFYPEKHLIESKDPVTAKQPGQVVHAVGMNIDTATGKIKLLSKVRGMYDPSYAKD